VHSVALMNNFVPQKQISRVLSTVMAIALTACLANFVTSSAWGADQCATIFSAREQSAGAVRGYSEIKDLKVMAFNVKDLFWSQANADYLAQKGKLEKGEELKPEAQIEQIRSIIDEVSPDVFIATEVESLTALQHLGDNRLHDKYNAYLIEGNDQRGIDIGFMVRRDLPFVVEEQTHKDLMWFDPVDKKEAKLFSRDAPALLLRKSVQEKPFLIVVGNHAKSQRNREGDPESKIVRKAQYEAIAKIIEDYKQQFPGTPVILAGDFNTDVNLSPEVRPLLSVVKSGFDVALKATPKAERFTHFFFPRDGSVVRSQLDDIKVSSELEHSILDARIYRYKRPDGTIMRLPKTFQERELQPSDHFPIVMRLSTEVLWH
jgi:hypothetical protein